MLSQLHPKRTLFLPRLLHQHKVINGVKRNNRKKQFSKILTDTPVLKELEIAQEKKRLREENIKKKKKSKTPKKKTVRYYNEKTQDKT